MQAAAKSTAVIEEAFAKVMTSAENFVPTGHRDVFITKVPEHWRANKQLPTKFRILFFQPIADDTEITVSAGNDETSCADLKNNTTKVKNQQAEFNDLRFVGRSGRGKNFNLSITIFHRDRPREVVTVENMIKVTVDGPREARNNKAPVVATKRPLQQFSSFFMQGTSHFPHIYPGPPPEKRVKTADFPQNIHQLPPPMIPPHPMYNLPNIMQQQQQQADAQLLMLLMAQQCLKAHALSKQLPQSPPSPPQKQKAAAAETPEKVWRPF